MISIKDCKEWFVSFFFLLLLCREKTIERLLCIPTFLKKKTKKKGISTFFLSKVPIVYLCNIRSFFFFFVASNTSVLHTYNFSFSDLYTFHPIGSYDE